MPDHSLIGAITPTAGLVLASAAVRAFEATKDTESVLANELPPPEYQAIFAATLLVVFSGDESVPDLIQRGDSTFRAKS
jgi:hypothetical protein